MSKCRIIPLSIAAALLFSGLAQASSVDLDPGPVSISSVPTIVQLSPNFGGVSAMSSSTLTVNVNVTATNDLTWTWTGFLLELPPGGNATFKADNPVPSCTEFGGCHDSGNEYILEWKDDHLNAVAPGGSAMFSFGLSITGNSQYTYDLTMTPIPEPATIALLGMGALALVRRKPS